MLGALCTHHSCMAQQGKKALDASKTDAAVPVLICPHTLVHCASAYYYMCIRVSQFCQSDTPHPLHKEKGKEIFFPFTLFLL